MCIQEQINMIQCVREDTANHWWLQYYIETMAVPRCPKASETLSTANASVFSTFILKEVEEAGVQIAQYFLPLWRIIRSQIQAKYSSAKSFVVKKKISDSRVGHDVRWESSSCNDKQLWKTSWLIVDRRPEQNKSDVASIVSGRFHVQPIVIKLIWFEKRGSLETQFAVCKTGNSSEGKVLFRTKQTRAILAVTCYSGKQPHSPREFHCAICDNSLKLADSFLLLIRRYFHTGQVNG